MRKRGHGTLLSLRLPSCQQNYSLQQAQQSQAVTRTGRIRRCTMGNNNTAFQMSNHSKRNVRVFIKEKALEIDAFIASVSQDLHEAAPALPGDKKFGFRKDVDCIRVLASQTREVPWEAQQFVSVFVEDEDDEKVCSKQIIHNMELTSPVVMVLYDV